MQNGVIGNYGSLPTELADNPTLRDLQHQRLLIGTGVLVYSTRKCSLALVSAESGGVPFLRKVLCEASIM
jgi:hypothetical protein